MIQDTLVPITNHAFKINEYINWLFKRKQEFVILKQYVNKQENITKMFIAIPTRCRVFENSKINLLDSTIFNIPTFPFSAENIKEFKTLYSGDMFNFSDIVHLLSTIKVKRNVRLGETITLFRDYTCSKEEQLHKYNLVDIGRAPIHSINSIYRLLHTKYVTIVEVKFNNINAHEA